MMNSHSIVFKNHLLVFRSFSLSSSLCCWVAQCQLALDEVA